MTREQKHNYAALTDLLHWAVHDNYCVGGSSEDEFRLAVVVFLRDMADRIATQIHPLTTCPSKR